ncbi:GDSL-type esterase/lipase family protein [Wenyingzhuangia sp. chi5]|uniref:GDSL-type esterase/lipase family protein n=1 Tax=Wenyingzhuangia gilva TaxID=3057677 RepID=A0ABT8VN49_9FLAO|nr:GDSL-type esterase/lipase family protein [Wenyingzhuangia sp. chi5]MDO3693400.1 GDSL-type esterase/lipase family protein [Wenyingzhuangia sp. chi5]
MFWYHEELERLEREKKKLTYKPNMVFYGSSSFNLWNEIPKLFKEFTPINMAFGGSTLAACSWFYKKNFKGLNPRAVMIYAGDNDLGDGRHPEEVVLFFRTLLDQIRKDYGNIPVTFVSIKPSPSRWYLEGSIRYTNSNIKEITKEDKNLYFIDIYEAMLDASGKPNKAYFIEDGLHLNSKGYKVWYDIIKTHKESFPVLEMS